MTKKVYIIDFNANISNTGDNLIDSLTEQISLLLKVLDPSIDEILIRLTSPGGSVTSYGLAANQLQRIKNAKIKLTICVDEIAASGGYMMSCVGDKIVAAPFSFIGSIGVVALVPNFQRVTKDKLSIDVYQFTAGKYKRTVDMFGEVTEESKQKLKEELEDIHKAFINHVSIGRMNKLTKPQDEIFTGEAWLAIDALKLGLVDEIKTSDEYIDENFCKKGIDVFVLRKRKTIKKRNLAMNLLGISSSIMDTINKEDGIFLYLQNLFKNLLSGKNDITTNNKHVLAQNFDELNLV